MSQANNPKELFSVKQDKRLVAFVSKYPCLFDVSDPLYKNQQERDNAWKDVTENVGRSIEDCKRRWRNIKDTYHKRQRKGRRTGTTSSSGTKIWALAEMLSFLGHVEHKRLSSVSLENDEPLTQEDAEEFVKMEGNTSSASPEGLYFHPASPNMELVRSPNKRHKSNESNQSIEDKNDRIENMKDPNQNRDESIDLFFKSIAMSVKNLRPDLINEAKMKSLQMVFELESRNNLPSSIKQL